MILQPTSKPGSEVRREDKTSLGPSNVSAKWLPLATPRRSVPVLAHFCPWASLSPEECQGGDLESFPQFRMNGCPPHSLPSPSTFLLYSEGRSRKLWQASVGVLPSSPHYIQWWGLYHYHHRIISFHQSISPEGHSHYLWLIFRFSSLSLFVIVTLHSESSFLASGVKLDALKDDRTCEKCTYLGYHHTNLD